MISNLQVLQPSGILDSTQANNFRDQIITLVETNVPIIIIDFQEVTFMDSSGLGALVLALKTAQNLGSRILICSINEQLKMLFELTGVDQVFEIFPNRETLEDNMNYP